MPVYFIQSGENGPVKIGFAKDAFRRLPQLQTNHPHKLHLRRLFVGTVEDERALHLRFASLRLSGEWFCADDAILCGDIPLEPLPLDAPPSEARAGWTDDSYLSFRAKIAALNQDADYRARRTALARRVGAASAIGTSAMHAAMVVFHLSHTPHPKEQRRLRRQLRDLMGRMERIHADHPDILDFIRSESAGYRAAAAKRVADLCAALAAAEQAASERKRA